MKFVEYNILHLDACLRLFDLNCPGFFAPNERNDYEAFLDRSHKGYQVGIIEDKVIAAFGFRVQKNTGLGLISWIMVSPEVKGQGVGYEMMAWVRQEALQQNISTVDIAASHLSAPFFSKCGAAEINTIPDGWGPGMHRVNMKWVL